MYNFYKRFNFCPEFLFFSLKYQKFFGRPHQSVMSGENAWASSLSGSDFTARISRKSSFLSTRSKQELKGAKTLAPKMYSLKFRAHPGKFLILDIEGLELHSRIMTIKFWNLKHLSMFSSCLFSFSSGQNICWTFLIFLEMH